MEWYKKTINEVIEAFKTSQEGLSLLDAESRLKEYGPNELQEKKKKTPFMMFLDQFKDFMIVVLLVAAVISGFIGELIDTLAIVVIVVLNAVIGFVQEFRAEKAMEALKRMSSPNASVLRGGVLSDIPSSNIVPGDVIILEAGRIIPADMRIIEAVQFKVDESALTGESVPVEKTANQLNEDNLSLGDRKNMLYKGTFVTYGRGRGIVAATGMNTELGKIASMIQQEEEVKTPLQKRLASFGKRLAIIVLIICAVVFTVGLLRGEPPLLMLLTAISLAVAAIPEALPAVITISLAIGAKKMVKQNALIRALPAVETLGSVTYICSDKTGTLTQNKMVVEKFHLPGKPSFDNEAQIVPAECKEFLKAAALSNDAAETSEGGFIGDPTETALYAFAKKYGFNKKDLEDQLQRVAEIPFDSERKRMTTFHKWNDGKFISFTKGASESVVERSSNMLAFDKILPVETTNIHNITETLAENGLRVLAFSMRLWDELPTDMSPDNVELDMTFLGLIGMMDPPRVESTNAVALCKKAGIKTVMITGDHPVTANAIAKRIGIVDDAYGKALTGAGLEAMTDDEFIDKVEGLRCYARVAPEQKLRIVKALQEKGQFVAMTGDGVNDAPALKRSNIGIAMGITGTDVSKEASHMILLDDNFSTIVNAVKEGRKIYDNIRKFIKYLLSTNAGEVITLFLAPIVGLPMPLMPIHILWVNLVTDGLPALALTTEQEEGDVMSKPPRHPNESIFAHGLGITALWVGSLMALIVLSLQAVSLYMKVEHWQTMVFSVLCFTQLANVLAIRTERESVFKDGFFKNRYVIGAVVISFVLQMAVIYIPALNVVFKTQPLSFTEFMVTIIVSIPVFFAVELEKRLILSRKALKHTK